MPDAYAEFDAQKIGYGFSYTLSLGTQPGIARVSSPLDSGRVGSVGVLDIFWQGRLFLRLKDARIANPTSPGSTTSAPTREWTIEDRRWKWQYGAKLDGDFNVPQKKTGTLLREKNPRQIATEIFKALGEKNVDVNALPSDPRPRIQWRAEDPAQELERFCQLFGCAPSYNPINDTVSVVKLGQGSSPPNRPEKSRVDAVTTKAKPDNLVIVGANTWFQSVIELGEYVGEDVDGLYKKIDDLSYKPTGGWWGAGVDPVNFGNLNSQYTDLATGQQKYHRDLAKKSVFRCLRMTGQDTGGWSPKALKGKPEEPKSIKDLGPFPGHVLEKDSITGERLPAFATGVFADSRWNFKNKAAGDQSNNAYIGSRWVGSLQINNDLRIVTFDQPVFKFDSNSKPAATKMYLVAAYEVTHEGVPVYYTKSRRLAGKSYSAGDYREHREEIRLEIIEKKASATGKDVDNQKDMDKKANFYLDSIQDQYRDRPAANIVYSGLFKHATDGILRTVNWEASVNSAPQTTVSWDCEPSRSLPLWEDRPDARARRKQEAERRRFNAVISVAESRIRAILGR